MWKKVYSRGGIDLKDGVDKLHVSRLRVKLTWQDHVQLVIYKSCDHDIVIIIKICIDLIFRLKLFI